MSTDRVYTTRVRQITVAAMSGPEADEFLLKVKQAATGPPWYSHAKPVVNIARFKPNSITLAGSELVRS